jgi:hypothetical protein
MMFPNYPLPKPEINDRKKCPHCNKPLKVVTEYIFSNGREWPKAWHYEGCSNNCKKLHT